MQTKTSALTLTLTSLLMFSATPIYAESTNTPTTAPLTHAMESLTNKDAGIVATYYQDLDQDGVKDQVDQCPNTLPNTPVNPYGCELDSDADGVFDRLDQCPNTPTDTTVNQLGCENENTPLIK